MKSINSILILLACILGLASCEMKDELTNKNQETALGRLTVGVELKNANTVTTKADDALENSFPVTIYKDNVAYKSFESYSALQSAGEVELPAGTYVVEAHSATSEDDKDNAYYKGSETVIIESGVTTQTTVSCTMQNIKFQLFYSTEFLTKFTTWTVIVTPVISGSTDNGIVRIYDQTQPDPSPTYFKAMENVSVYSMKVTAVTIAGETITKVYEIDKSNATNKDEVDSPYFVGGDFMKVTLAPGKDPELPAENNGGSFTVTVDLGWANSNETIEIPVEEEGSTTDPSEPETPTTDTKPTLTSDYFTNPVAYSITAADMPSSVDVLVKAPKGIASMIVTITGGNADFTAVMGDMGFDKGLEMVDNTEINELFSGLGIAIVCPTSGATEYTFPVGQFLGMMNIYGPTVDADETTPDGKDAHVFTMKLTDKEGNSVEKTLMVKISK